MAFVAIARVKFGDGFLTPGDAVPVEPGRNYDRMVSLGQIALVPDTDEATGSSRSPRGEGKRENAQDTDKPLEDRTRDELNELAVERGVENPDRLPNKGAVIEAIEQS